jgi:hypothetical protein
MTRSAFALACVAGLALVTLCSFPAAAMSLGHRAHASVPFAFKVNETIFPAGDYTVEMRPDLGVVVFYEASGKGHAFSTTPLGNPNQLGGGRLVFVKTGPVHRLAEAWHSAVGQGAGFPSARAPRLMGKSGAGAEGTVVRIRLGAPPPSAQ